ncbi:MAG: malate dehydrogenase [Campylobacter sp.]|nr:malate dehydrogenase [Campylobacter sp.]
MKISIIGAGNVGASIAYAMGMRGVCEKIALVDIFANVAQAKAMDIMQAGCVFCGRLEVVGGDDFALIKDSDIVVVTAGSPRKEGQSRDDLLLKNAEVVKQTAENIAKFAPNSIIIVVTNPLDVMVWTAWKYSGFDKSRVIGMAGELDSARCRYETAILKDINARDISAKVVGSHNDKMIVSAKNINQSLNLSELKTIRQETKTGGAKIVKLLGTSAYYAPAAAVVKMCEAIKEDSNEILAVSVILSDELSCGRFVRLKKSGLSEILALNLDEQETGELKSSEEERSANIKFLKENLV